MTTSEGTRATGTTPGLPTASRGRARLRRLLVRSTLASGVAAAVVLGGAAVAAWNVTGTGSGSAGAAEVDELAPVTLTIAASLYPGLTTDATLFVTNPNPFPVRLIDIEFGAISVEDAPGCTPGNSGVTFEDILGVTDATYLIAADDDNSFLLEDVVTMAGNADDACQGANFSVAIELNAESAAP